MNFKKRLSLSAGKSTKWALRKLNRGATMLPGKIALTFDKDILSKISKDVETIIVAGTNGKTTTALMLSQGLNNAGLECFSNSSGANMLTGICAEYIENTDSKGNPKKKYAVIECDEASLQYVVPQINPKVILVTNVFRDQLDRYGEVLSTLKLIEKGIEKSDNHICVLNGDCSLMSSLPTKKNTIYYGFDMGLTYNESEVNDVTRCLKCGSKMNYHNHTYGHMGDFYCPDCDYKRPELDVSLVKYEATTSNSKLEIKDKDNVYKFNLALPAVYNVYNALSSFAVFEALGIDKKPLIETLSSMKSAFGRMEKFSINDNFIEMILVKNPAGCNRVLEYLELIEEEINLAILLNDKAQDGTDISWIWDGEFAKFVNAKENVNFFVSGTRKEDMALRLKYAGVKKLKVCNSYEELYNDLENSKLNSIIMPNYTPMLEMRALLKEKCGGKDFWEK